MMLMTLRMALIRYGEFCDLGSFSKAVTKLESREATGTIWAEKTWKRALLFFVGKAFPYQLTLLIFSDEYFVESVGDVFVDDGQLGSQQLVAGTHHFDQHLGRELIPECYGESATNRK